jgi:hypothetical protein
MSLLDPWAIWGHQRVNWRPHQDQINILESRARHRVWCAGRRTGKSDLGGNSLLPEAFYTKSVANDWLKLGKRREFWIVGPEYSDSEKEFRVIYNRLKSLQVPFDRPGTYYDPIGHNMHISLWEGAFQVHAHSAKYPDHLVGEALCGVLMVEAAKAKPSIWHKYIRPMLNDYKGWSMHTSTPEGKNHFFEKYEMGQDPFNSEWESWRVPSWHNPYVHTIRTVDEHVKFMLDIMVDHPSMSAAKICRQHNLQIDKEIIDLADDLSVEMFKQEIAADFTEFVGQVFKDYDEEYHVGNLEFEPEWQTFAGVDYGYTNPNVWLLIQVGPWGEINILDEVYEPGLTADQFAEEIKRRGLNPPQLRIFYPDPADPMSSRTLEDKLRIKASGGTGGELPIRINLIREKLRKGRIDMSQSALSEQNADKWRPQLMIDRKCARLRSDMMAYRYPERKDDKEDSLPRFELPMKKDDHGPEALGRFMIGFFGAGELHGHGGTRVRKGNVSRRHTQKTTQRQDYRSVSPPMKPLSSMITTKSGFPNWKEWR